MKTNRRGRYGCWINIILSWTSLRQCGYNNICCTAVVPAADGNYLPSLAEILASSSREAWKLFKDMPPWVHFILHITHQYTFFKWIECYDLWLTGKNAIAYFILLVNTIFIGKISVFNLGGKRGCYNLYECLCPSDTTLNYFKLAPQAPSNCAYDNIIYYLTGSTQSSFSFTHACS